MKNKFIITLAAMACAISLHAATAIGVAGTPGVASYAVNSANGTTNSTSLATNGLYSAGIAASTTETNLVLINPGSSPNSRLVLQLTSAGMTASTSNTLTFVISASALPVTITNSTTTGANYSATTRGTFASYALALNGTTSVTTNIVLNASSTPAIANGLNLYMETIAVSGAGANVATNYSVVVVP
jgi:hypothetical protein